MRIDISGSFTDNAAGFTGSATCSGGNVGAVAPVPILVRFSFRVDEVDGGLLTIAGVDPGGPMLKMATSFCSNSSYAIFVQSDATAALGDIVAAVADQSLRPAIEASLAAQLCMRAGDGGVCPLGSRGDGGLCVNSAGRCYSGLHFRPAIPTIPACLQ
ncbi:MAG: hypothetical protein ABTQ32_28140 [Myxococcaceae bacterium]